MFASPKPTSIVLMLTILCLQFTPCTCLSLELNSKLGIDLLRVCDGDCCHDHGLPQPLEKPANYPGHCAKCTAWENGARLEAPTSVAVDQCMDYIAGNTFDGRPVQQPPSTRKVLQVSFSRGVLPDLLIHQLQV